MNIILLERVEKLGKLGDVVSVIMWGGSTKYW